MLIIEKLISDLNARKNPSKAVGMKAYMKDHFEFIGLPSPERKELQKEYFKAFDALNHWDVTYELWNQPEREFQYIALDYLKKLSIKKYQRDDFRMLEELITTKSWWDTVDGIASNNVGKYFQAYPKMRDDVVRKWRKSENIWLKRTTLLFQLKYGEKTDFELMKDLILEFNPINEFFIQKAIGWALRQYSKTNPEAVKAFVQTIDLKTVARKEAYKYI